ncbi:MAG: OmpH family outer membrane protein [Microscillaceae bacterium]|nr:OmpH family outer membrane protein [Microscillaceae bacterium]
MKNISIAIQAVLSVAILVLYVLFFSQKSGSTTGNSALKSPEKTVVKAEKKKEKSSIPSSSPRFAYLNSDTLLAKYEFYQKIQKQIENRRSSFESSMRNSQSAFQNEVMSFQRSLQEGKINEQTARQTEQNLMKKEQSLAQEGQNLENKLFEETKKLNKELHDRVTDFLRRFAEENDYQIIFSYSANALSAGVMHADPSLEVTNEVVKGLNEEYKAEKK